MEDNLDVTLDDTSKPVWENMVESPVIDYVPASIPSCKYKLKLKYGGFFRLAKNSCKIIYCFGSQKCIYIDTWSYNLSQLNEEVIRRYSSKNNPDISICYADKYASNQSFIQLDSDERFMAMLIMYVEIDFDVVGDKKLFKRFFISLAACSRGFLAGCRPYISLDACHLKGKFNGVLAAAVSIDGNNSIFAVAYGVLESENKHSWTWFLESLKKSIGTPSGLVISSDMQKGLEVAIMHVYPNVEHRECIRHLSGNFKKKFRGKFFNSKLWSAAKTYLPIEHDNFLKEISDVSEAPITYLNNNHGKVWSKSKFCTTSKCDYITNNIAESFNSWINVLRFLPVIDLLDGIRGKLMKRFDKKRRKAEKMNGILVPIAKKHLDDISKNLGGYEVCRSSNSQAEVKFEGKQWDVYLDERRCSCRVWQVTGLPCVNAAAFIAFTRDVWEKYVDPCYTIETFKKAYAFEIAPMSGSDQWMQKDGEKIYPPIIKRPIGRQKKNQNKIIG